MIRSQKADARPIAFALLRNSQPVGGLDGVINLNIRPEELTRHEPSRLQVAQTLGGAWVDDFGRGIERITIQGHTGWRGGNLTRGMGDNAKSISGPDGAELFGRLRDLVYVRWHALRAEARDAGRDPDKDVELVLSDALDEFAIVVAPHHFTLRRNKNRPLLMMYSIEMTALREASAPHYAPARERLQVDELGVDPPAPSEAAIQAIADAAAAQREAAAEAQSILGPGVAQVRELADKSAALLDLVHGIAMGGINTIDAQTAPIIAIATEVQRASRNMIQVLVEVVAVQERAKRVIRDVYAAYGEALCNLENSFRVLRRFLDFSDMFGAAYCSSTTGGRAQSALIRENPFLVLYSTGAPAAGLTSDGAAAVAEAAQDVLALNARSIASKLDLIRRVADGIVV
jgi:hypothetical protein